MDRETEEIIIIGLVTLFLGIFNYIGWHLINTACSIIRLRSKFKNKATKGYGKITRLSKKRIVADSGSQTILILTFTFSDGVNQHVIDHVFPNEDTGLSAFNILEPGQSIPILFFPNDPKLCIPKIAETYPVTNEYKRILIGILIILLSTAATFGFLTLFEEYDDSIPINGIFIQITIVCVVAMVYPLMFLFIRCVFCKNIGKEPSYVDSKPQIENSEKKHVDETVKEIVSDEEIMSDIVMRNHEIVTKGNDDIDICLDADEIIEVIEGNKTVNDDAMMIGMTAMGHNGHAGTKGNQNDDEDFDLDI